MAGNAGKRFRDVRCNAPPFFFQRSQNFADVGSILFSEVRFAATIQTTIIVGDWRDVNPRLLSASPGSIEFVRTDIDERVGMPVVSVLEHNNIFAAGVRAGDTQREFVGFAARIYEVADAQRRRKKRSEPLGVTIGVVVQIACVGVEDGYLVLHSANYPRMRVTDERNVIVDVQKSATGVIEKILPPAANDFQWMAVRDAEIFAQQRAACRERLVKRGSGRWKMAGGNAEDEVGIGRKAEPDRTLGGEGHAGKIGGAIEKVENNLKMQMRRPAAIFARVADVREDFATRDALANFQ